MKTIIIQQGYLGILYENGMYIKTLNPGKHKFKIPYFKSVERNVTVIDVRERTLTIKGQEILTADKVAIRVSILVYFKVKDAIAAQHNVASYEDRIYEDVQLAARRYLASKSLDAILNDRNEISDSVRDNVKESASSYGVEIIRADVKDLVFPGNLRDIMNQVLETERRSEAKLIEARKEAEVLKIKNDAQNTAQLNRLEYEKKEIKLKAEADKERLHLKLESEIEEAKALMNNKTLLKLKQLEVLRELAKSGNGKFVLGLNVDGISRILDEK